MPSELYKAGIYAPVRRTRAKVTFSLVAPEAKEQAAITASAGNGISRPAQVVDSVRELTGRFASFEPEYWRLDGGFILPLPPGESTAEVGYWSGVMSDGDGIFAEPLSILVAFDEVQDIPAVGVMFDSMAGETAADFDIILRSVNGGTLFSQSFEGNGADYVRTESGAQNVIEAELIIRRTANPYRFARVAELDFGVVLIFENDRILELDMIREADTFGEAFPINELNVTISNDGSFDQLDGDSLAGYLNRRQSLEYSHGLELTGGATEWVHCGTYYLDNWSVSDNRVAFTAFGMGAGLENGMYCDSTFDSFTVGQLAERIGEAAGFNVSVPESLQGSPAVRGYFGNVDYRRALVQLGMLSGCLVYEDRNNGLVFRDILEERVVGDSVTYASLFEQPKIRQNAYYNAICLTERSMCTEFGALGSLEMEVSGTTDFIIYYDRPCLGAVTMAAEGFALSGLKYAVMYVRGKIAGQGSAVITATGNVVRFNAVDTIYPAPWHTGREKDYPFAIDLPMMITGGSGYSNFRAWFLERRFALLQKRITCEMNWRQNPAQEIGDRIELQAGKNKSVADMYVYRESVGFDRGVLSGSARVIGEGSQY